MKFELNEIALMDMGNGHVPVMITGINGEKVTASTGKGNQSVSGMLGDLRKDMLERFEFRCTGCLKKHKMSGYPIAQLAMGHGLTHTCDCGNQTYLDPDDF